MMKKTLKNNYYAWACAALFSIVATTASAATEVSASVEAKTVVTESVKESRPHLPTDCTFRPKATRRTHVGLFGTGRPKLPSDRNYAKVSGNGSTENNRVRLSQSRQQRANVAQPTQDNCRRPKLANGRNNYGKR